MILEHERQWRRRTITPKLGDFKVQRWRHVHRSQRTSCGVVVVSVQCSTSVVLSHDSRRHQRDHSEVLSPQEKHVAPMAASTETSGVKGRISGVAHQSLTSTAPTYQSADIQLVSEHGRHLRSSFYRTLTVPRTRTTLGDRSLCGTVYRLL